MWSIYFQIITIILFDSFFKSAIGSQIKNNIKPKILPIARESLKTNIHSDYKGNNDSRSLSLHRRNLKSDNSYLSYKYVYNKAFKKMLNASNIQITTNEPKQITNQLFERNPQILRQLLPENSVQGNPMFNKQSTWSYQNVWGQQNQNQQNQNQQNQNLQNQNQYQQNQLQFNQLQNPGNQNQIQALTNTILRQQYQNPQNPNQENRLLNPNQIFYPPGPNNQGSQNDPQGKNYFPNRQNVYSLPFKNQNQDFSKQGLPLNPQYKRPYPMGQYLPNQNSYTQNQVSFNLANLNPSVQYHYPSNHYLYQQNKNLNKQSQFYGRQGPNSTPPGQPTGQNPYPPNQNPNLQNQNPYQPNQLQNPPAQNIYPPSQNLNQQNQLQNPLGQNLYPPNQNPNSQDQNPSQQSHPWNPLVPYPSNQNPPQNHNPNNQNPALYPQNQNPNPPHMTPSPSMQDPLIPPRNPKPYQQNPSPNQQNPNSNQQNQNPMQQNPIPNQQNQNPTQQNLIPNQQNQNPSQQNQNPNQQNQNQQNSIPSSDPGLTIQVTPSQLQTQNISVTTEEYHGISTPKHFLNYADIPGWLEEATAKIPEITDFTPESATEYDYVALLPDTDIKPDIKHRVIEDAELGMMKYQLGFMLGFFHQLLLIMGQVNKKGSTHDLYVALKQYIEQMLRDGTLNEMGHGVQKAMHYCLILLVDWTPDEVQARIELGIYTIQHREEALSEAVRKIVDQLDQSYSLEEGTLLLKTLIDVDNFTKTYNDTGLVDNDNNTNTNMTTGNVKELKDAHEVVKKIVDALLVPFWNALPANRLKLFDRINTVIEENYMDEITGKHQSDIHKRSGFENETRFDNAKDIQIRSFDNGIIKSGAANRKSMVLDFSFNKQFLVSNDRKRENRTVYNNSKSSKLIKKRKIFVESTTKISKETYKYDRFNENLYNYEKSLRQKHKKYGFSDIKDFTEAITRVSKYPTKDVNEKYVTIESVANVMKKNKQNKKINSKAYKERNNHITDQYVDEKSENNQSDESATSDDSEVKNDNSDVENDHFFDTFEENVKNDAKLRSNAKLDKISIKSNLHKHDFKPSIVIHFDNNVEKRVEDKTNHYEKSKSDSKLNQVSNRSKLNDNDYKATTINSPDDSLEKNDEKLQVNEQNDEILSKFPNKLRNKDKETNDFHKTQIQISDVQMRNVNKDSSTSLDEVKFKPDHLKKSLIKDNSKSNERLIKHDVISETKHITRNFLEESNETDEENELKMRLSDALRHSDFDYNKIKRNNNFIKIKRKMFESSMSNEEAMIKRNIYKVFG